MASHEVTPCFGEHAPLEVEWGFSSGTFASSQLVKGVLRNYRPYAVSVEVSLVARGLGGRTIAETVGTWNIAASSKSVDEVRVSFDKLPVQSVGAPSTVAVVARLVNEPDAEPYTLGTLSYEFTKGYASVTVYPTKGRASSVGQRNT